MAEDASGVAAGSDDREPAVALGRPPVGPTTTPRAVESRNSTADRSTTIGRRPPPARASSSRCRRSGAPNASISPTAPTAHGVLPELELQAVADAAAPVHTRPARGADCARGVSSLRPPLESPSGSTVPRSAARANCIAAHAPRSGFRTGRGGVPPGMGIEERCRRPRDRVHDRGGASPGRPYRNHHAQRGRPGPSTRHPSYESVSAGRSTMAWSFSSSISRT